MTQEKKVITGGNSGIGLATAQRFVQEGAFVFISVAARMSSRKQEYWQVFTVTSQI
jgi:NAD(P)-dependent dehydrogenase (short-subunit alcohol dehydrogenase family)